MLDVVARSGHRREGGRRLDTAPPPVALGNTALVADDLAAGRLVWPFALCLPTMFAYYVVCPEATTDDPTVTAFREWLLAEATA